MDPNQFRRACAQFATGVAIATALDAQGQPHGMTVNSFTSVSISPPLVLISIDHASNLLGVFKHCGRYGLSFLSHHQQAISQRFAGRGHDRFVGVEWVPGPSGLPLIPGALAHLECRIDNTVGAGDHTLLIAEVVSADIHTGTPLLYFRSGYRRME